MNSLYLLSMYDVVMFLLYSFSVLNVEGAL